MNDAILTLITNAVAQVVVGILIGAILQKMEDRKRSKAAQQRFAHIKPPTGEEDEESDQ